MAKSPRYFGWLWDKTDESNPTGVMVCDDTSRAIHFSRAANANTDWNVNAFTQPTFFIHSNTTPATDYATFSHDATNFTLNCASANYIIAFDGTNRITLTTAAMSPSTNDGNALGTTALMWSDLFVASGAVINFNNGNVTLTHSAGALTLAGGSLTTNNSVISTSATAGIGYGTGAGGTVTQATSKSTGVTLNTVTGAITMNAAALAADTSVSFTLTNSAIAATDAVVLTHESGGTLGAYGLSSTAAAGSAVISIHNSTPGSLSEAVVLRFVVIKSVNA